MDSRREFLKKAALLAAGGGLAGAFPASIQKAFAIDPDPGTTFMDAEHIVILMQENRSFDHCYGTLRGVRGFNDPRAVSLPNGNPVWLQTNARGETYAPFRLNIKDTKATWMSSLPHSWGDQTAARNDGKHDRWLDAKPSGNKEYAKLPLTLGFYNRDDIPFYYALADAFTVCDQNFCSSLTGTTPNRLYLWTGTIREQPSIQSKANVWNSDVDYDSEANWTTFPERLEDAGVSWRIYQNELSLDTGLAGDAEGWLANFTDNPLEWFQQYHVRYHATYRRNLPARAQALTAKLKQLESRTPATDALKKKIAETRAELETVRHDQVTYTEANFAKLSPREQSLHRKAFTTNQDDPNYRELATLTYRDGAKERQMAVPKGDVLHQFREDVRLGKLPTVSWIVAPENFSDHPGAPWYGAWYLSETLDILTQNPDVWKKTIFVLCYDENDGYYDHVPPFVPPQPGRPDAGKTSVGIEASVEHVRSEPGGQSGPEARTAPIGLGFRVPLVIASPWSRGGYVCSQVFDHTSILQLLEKMVSHKAGRLVRETNISAWRRTVCGDLSSVFRPYRGEKIELPKPVERAAFLGSIHQAQFKQLPNGFKNLNVGEMAQARENPHSRSWMPAQEKGVRPACALPYELAVDGSLSPDRKSFVIQFAAGKQMFGANAAGAPFHVYAPGNVPVAGKTAMRFENGPTWAYAVAAGDQLADQWLLGDFDNATYHLRVHGPNGFYREFRGGADDPALDVKFDSAAPNARLRLVNRESRPVTIQVDDLAYGDKVRKIELGAAGTTQATAEVILELGRSNGWHDLHVRVQHQPRFEQRFAGHIETGKESISDPAMGQELC
ncbi:MAG: phospholipase C, phosphocholine-specific [Verrucomicrobia bacterium]|nr:phospholipase C, phosphocholine-specific [Verrucomicrobiota bacterium]